MNNSYLKGLNTLRFFAAFLVIIYHGVGSLCKLNIIKGDILPIFTKEGDGVEFFFVLSGFLITYLLLKEYNKTGNVSIKQFYLRRVFRIWPLYVLIILIGLLLLGYIYPLIYHKPYFNFPIWKWIILYIIFLPNLAIKLYPMGLLYPLWSIGVEEQFYLFWAPVFKLCRNKILITIFIFIFLSSIWQILLEFKIFVFSDYLVNFFKSQKFYAMSIGAFFGYVFFNWKTQFQKSILAYKFMQYFILILVLLHLFLNLPFSEYFLYKFLLASCFGYIILNTVCDETTIFKLEKKPFVYLGTISYGLYMFHMVVDYFLRTIYSKFNFSNYVLLGSLFYILLLLGLTVLVASISFKYFENYFLRLKGKHSA